MRKDSRLSRALHLIAHLSHSEQPVSSKQLAKLISTNPVVVRRLLGILAEHDLVRSIHGRGGGWVLSCHLTNISLKTIYQALEITNMFTINLTDEHKNCYIEKNIHKHIDAVLKDAEISILQQFKHITLDQLI